MQRCGVRGRLVFAAAAAGFLMAAAAAAAEPKVARQAAEASANEGAPADANAAAEATADADAAPPTAAERLRGPRVTVGPRTTYITEPLREDGYPDYLAALDARFRAGVTPQTNAAVVFCQVMGPACVDEDRRAEFFRRLGIETPPEDGRYFVTWDRFLAAEEIEDRWSEEYWQQFNRATADAWSADDLPLVARWIARNDELLDRLVAGVERPHWYTPLVGDDAGDSMMLAVRLEHISTTREAGRALKARAMLRLGRGDAAGAQRDLLAIHRLARHVGRGPTLIEGLVGIALDAIAAHGDAVLVHRGGLSADQARAYIVALRALPPLAEMADNFDVGERYFYLDTVCYLARKGTTELSILDGSGPCRPGVGGELLAAVGRALTVTAINWDIPLRSGNDLYDRLAAAARLPGFAERRAALRRIEQEFVEAAEQARDPRSLGRDLLAGKSPRTVASERITAVLHALFIPAAVGVVEAEARGVITAELAQLALVLAIYRAEQGEWPERLEALLPDYLERLPCDPYAPAAAGADGTAKCPPYRYRRTDEGFVLYSVGPSGEDHGGRSRMWGNGTGTATDTDDVVFRVPPPRDE